MFDSHTLSDILTRHADLEGPLLPILHDIQAQWGHIPDEAVGPIASALHLTRAEVVGVISFYHDFRKTPTARHVIRLCKAEACQSMGVDAVQARLEEALGMKIGQTQGNVTFEAVYCLGLCACAPAAQIDGELVARLTPDAVAEFAREVLA